MALFATSCVHEWPASPEVRKASVKVRHNLPWCMRELTFNDGKPTRSASPWKVRYIYEAYPAGTNASPVSRTVQYSDDVALSDFTTTLDLPVGDYDVYVWSDFVSSANDESPFYNLSGFADISLKEPYAGASETKDAFRGMFTVSIPSSPQETLDLNYEVDLDRPEAAYALIATDAGEFLKSTSRGDAEGVDFNGYTARISYNGFMPWVYDIFRNNPIDSRTGISFTAPLRRIDENRILISFDYMFVNNLESTANIALEIFDSEGKPVSSVASIEFPVKRSCATIISGAFLTSQAHGGIGIDPGFDGEYDIEIK